MLERGLAFARAAVAGMAVALGLFLLFHAPLVATFRAALVALAALEVLAFGTALVRGAAWRAWVEIGVKLAVLGGGYAALSG